MTRPIFAGDLRPSDVGVELHVGEGLTGRVASIHHAALGVVIELERHWDPIYRLRDEIVFMDDASWEAIQVDELDRRTALNRALTEQAGENTLTLLKQALFGKKS